MDEEQETPKATHRLSEIETETIGLVQRGANNSTFFLLKAQQEAPPMDDELEIEEVEETPLLEDDTPPLGTSPPEVPIDDGFFEKMRSQFEKWGIIKARASKDALAAAAKMLKLNPKQMAKLYGQMMDGEDEDEEEMEMGRTGNTGRKKPGKQGETRKDAPPESEETMTQDDIQKAIEAAYEAKNEALVKSVKAELEKAYQDKVTALETQVESLSKEATDQRDQREEREFLEKAMTFRCFPVQYTELGGMLRQLHKSLDKEAYEKWESVLKAADAQLFTSGLFNEMGTTRTADEVVLEEKAERIAKEKGIPLKEALLGMDRTEQLKLLRENQGGKR